MPALPLKEIMSPDWAEALAPVEHNIRAMGDFLRQEHQAGRRTLPPSQQIFRAFQEPLAQVKVLIIGQDPYPTIGHAMGLSFSVHPQVRPIPRSLQNIYRELSSDMNITPPEHGDLSAWTQQGVLLLNRVLSVGAGEAGSHRNRGWENITSCAIEALVQRKQPLVAILWGRDARNTKTLISPYPCIESAHPSPLSASRGFFGSRPFSKANELLVQQGAEPIDWRLPSSTPIAP
ncbi:uracil-DNA glycosylase [Rothia sp. P6271]|uniref:uracil-DNA glycosylase n=1 Tax=unclassified Rothia (in: high G+C Gram-positive bacteria) TaxID=2689056 RepID=UPI003AC4FAFC